MNFAVSFKIDLLEVNIYKLEEGVFYSTLICDDGKNKITVDARTSDAIALALRFKCPIFTTEEIMERAGIVIDIAKETKTKDTEKETEHEKVSSSPVSGRGKEEFKEYSDEELNQLLHEAVSKEDYERASLIRDELNKRKDS
jgi:hypothetical protein